MVIVRSKELWLVEKNHVTVTPDMSIASRGVKSYSESRIELRNLQILKKMLEKIKSVFVIGAAHAVSRKAWTLPWKLQEFKKIPSENLWLRST